MESQPTNPGPMKPGTMAVDKIILWHLYFRSNGATTAQIQELFNDYVPMLKASIDDRLHELRVGGLIQGVDARYGCGTGIAWFITPLGRDLILARDPVTAAEREALEVRYEAPSGRLIINDTALFVLSILSQSDTKLSSQQIIDRSGGHLAMPADRLENWLEKILIFGLLRRVKVFERWIWGITDFGRSQLPEPTHSSETREAPEPAAAAEIAEAQDTAATVEDDAEPSQAILCVDEDEVDNWWSALDVEAKADAFINWSLSNDGRASHVYIEPRRNDRIPVVRDFAYPAVEASGGK